MAESFRDTLTRLSTAQKGRAPGAPAYSVYVNRPAGRVLAAIAYRLGASPNGVSMTSALCTMAAMIVIMLVPPQTWLGIVVWLLLAVGYALDSADGQVARLRGGGSLAGEWLDHFIDSAKSIGLHLSVVIGVFRFFGLDSRVLLTPLAFALVAGVTFSGMMLNDLLKGKKGIASSTAAGGSTPLRALLLLPTDYGLLCLVFVLWGVPPAFVLAYSMVFLACTAFLVLAAAKWFRDMCRLDRELAKGGPNDPPRSVRP